MGSVYAADSDLFLVARNGCYFWEQLEGTSRSLRHPGVKRKTCRGVIPGKQMYRIITPSIKLSGGFIFHVVMRTLSTNQHFGFHSEKQSTLSRKSNHARDVSTFLGYMHRPAGPDSIRTTFGGKSGIVSRV